MAPGQDTSLPPRLRRQTNPHGASDVERGVHLRRRWLLDGQGLTEAQPLWIIAPHPPFSPGLPNVGIELVASPPDHSIEMPDNGHTPRSRDAALRRLARANRWLIAGSVTLTGALTAVAANAFPGRTLKTTGGSASAAAKRARASQQQGSGTSTGSSDPGSCSRPATAPRPPPRKRRRARNRPPPRNPRPPGKPRPRRPAREATQPGAPRAGSHSEPAGDPFAGIAPAGTLRRNRRLLRKRRPPRNRPPRRKAAPSSPADREGPRTVRRDPRTEPSTSARALATARWEALGSSVVLRVLDPLWLPRASAILTRELDALDRACSRFRPDSDLSRVNACAGGGPCRSRRC